MIVLAAAAIAALVGWIVRGIRARRRPPAALGVTVEIPPISADRAVAELKAMRRRVDQLGQDRPTSGLEQFRETLRRIQDWNRGDEAGRWHDAGLDRLLGDVRDLDNEDLVQELRDELEEKGPAGFLEGGDR